MTSKNLIGIVFSKNMNKTIGVKITKLVQHKKYKKFVKKNTKYYVHDEKNECQKNDTVIFKKSSPISKIKHWVLISKKIKG